MKVACDETVLLAFLEAYRLRVSLVLDNAVIIYKQEVASSACFLPTKVLRSRKIIARVYNLCIWNLGRETDDNRVSENLRVPRLITV